MQVALFGRLSIELADRRLGEYSFNSRKSKQVLELLLLQRGWPVPPLRLIDILWRDNPAPPNPLTTLHHYVSRLRRRLPRCPTHGSVILTSRSGYSVDQTHCVLDLDRFDAATAAADLARGADQLPRLKQALQLVVGDVLADEPDVAWARDIRSRYHRAHIRLLSRAAAVTLATGGPVAAHAFAHDALDLEPHDERSVCLLAAAHYALGDEAAAITALAALADCPNRVPRAFDLGPLSATTELQRAVVQGAATGEVVACALQIADRWLLLPTAAPDSSATVPQPSRADSHCPQTAQATACAPNTSAAATPAPRRQSAPAVA